MKQYTIVIHRSGRDRNPKTIVSLIKNLNNTENNAAMNGYSDIWYEQKKEA